MVIVHKGGVGRKPTGGRNTSMRGKRRFEIGHKPTATRIEDNTKRVVADGKFGHFKTRVLTADKVNLFDPKTKKYAQARVKAVLECAANRHYVRRNVMVRGTVVETEKGKARITSRPGQDGTVNAVLL
jgi:small subunit ribosomal protein S8e